MRQAGEVVMSDAGYGRLDHLCGILMLYILFPSFVFFFRFFFPVCLIVIPVRFFFHIFFLISFASLCTLFYLVILLLLLVSLSPSVKA